jgi:hypothetical protein
MESNVKQSIEEEDLGEFQVDPADLTVELEASFNS